MMPRRAATAMPNGAKVIEDIAAFSESTLSEFVRYAGRCGMRAWECTWRWFGTGEPSARFNKNGKRLPVVLFGHTVADRQRGY